MKIVGADILGYLDNNPELERDIQTRNNFNTTDCLNVIYKYKNNKSGNDK